jgi:SAM-dependent methyltransferase
MERPAVDRSAEDALFRSSREPSHRTTLDRILRDRREPASPHELFAGASDDFWLWCFTEGYRSDDRLRAILPAAPPDDVQCRFAGASGDDTVRDAFGFYSLVRSLVAQHGRGAPGSVLEFGCGWGRILRLFARDVAPQHLWGIDCLPAAIEICRETNPHSQFRLVDPLPPSGLPADSFDLVYAYSVFSHLSEAAHLAWLEEFRRVLRPGSLLVLTTRPRDFIFTCAALREAGEKAKWASGTTLAFKDTQDALARYDRGEYLFEPMSGGDVLDASFFGETCIPQQYVLDRWTDLFEFVGYIDDRRLCLQNVAVVRKRR